MFTFQSNILQNKPSLMGILNITPDSFFDGGQYLRGESLKKRVEEFIRYSADIIDIGGESTRPGADPLDTQIEIERVIPVIKHIKNQCLIPISIDTYKPETAEAALKAGALIVNDITGLQNPDMIKVVKDFNCFVIIMHIHGEPKSMQSAPLGVDELDQVIDFLNERVSLALKAGIDREKIWIDPGIGFGKTQELNIRIIRELNRLTESGFPVVLGVSRKSLIGHILDVPTEERLNGSVCVNMLGIQKGAAVIRVHDIKETRQMIKVNNAFS